jgi:thiol-disulfide isomerase/thioredoxin
MPRFEIHPKPLLAAAMLVGGVLAGWVLAGSTQAQIAWNFQLDAAQAKAARTNKPLLLHFYSQTCIPCRQLDQQVFGDPDLALTINSGTIPVKIDAQRHPDLLRRFDVSRTPTDLFLYPDGSQILKLASPADPITYTRNVHNCQLLVLDWVRSAGGRPGSDLPAGRHLPNPFAAQGGSVQTISWSRESENGYRVESSNFDFAGERKSTRQTLLNPFHAQGAAGAAERLLDRSPVAAPSLVTQPAADPANRGPVQSTAPAADSSVERLGMAGYCPVTLAQSELWQAGQSHLACKHRGQLFRFVDQRALELFMASPDLYAPVLSGFDVVAFGQHGQLVEGRPEFGLWLDQRVYLFASEQTRDRFQSDPHAYTQLINLVLAAWPTRR